MNTVPEELSELPDGFNFNDPKVYAKRVPHAEMRYIRKHDPVHWVETPYGTGGYNDSGYWAISKHSDVMEISKRTNNEFSSWERTAIPRMGSNETEQIDAQRLLLINQDGEQHAKKRRTISKGFTPRSIALLREALEQRAQKIVAKASAKEIGDFVVDVAAELPLQAIADLLGIPQEDRYTIFDWSNAMASYEDPEMFEQTAEASIGLLRYAQQMATDREKNPQNDLVTKLIQADIDGEKLSHEELGWFIVLLAFAGNETTRNATTHGMRAFLDNPEQWELFKKERPETAYDEILRWASPVASFQRTTTEDFEIRGKMIKKGDRVVLLYISANFDEDVFDDPFTFDITRDPNPHLTFGGNGPHYCIGANLAKLQIELIFNAIADVMPDISGENTARRVQSGWLNGYSRWQVNFGKCPVQH